MRWTSGPGHQGGGSYPSGEGMRDRAERWEERDRDALETDVSSNQLGTEVAGRNLFFLREEGEGVEDNAEESALRD